LVTTFHNLHTTATLTSSGSLTHNKNIDLNEGNMLVQLRACSLLHTSKEFNSSFEITLIFLLTGLRQRDSLKWQIFQAMKLEPIVSLAAASFSLC